MRHSRQTQPGNAWHGGLAERFGVIAVTECIGNRALVEAAWNLFYIRAKFADVESVDASANSLNNVEGFNRRIG